MVLLGGVIQKESGVRSRRNIRIRIGRIYVVRITCDGVLGDFERGCVADGAGTVGVQHSKR